MQIPVALFLDVKDPQNWTNQWGNHDNREGEIVVCHGTPEGDEIQFIGDPTPDMMPLDDEARAISASFEERWRYKPEDTVTNQGYSQSLVDRFQSEMATAQSKPAEVPGLSDLVAQMAASSVRQDKLLELLAAQATAPERRL